MLEFICLTWHSVYCDGHIAMSMLKQYVVQPQYKHEIGLIFFFQILDKKANKSKKNGKVIKAKVFPELKT